MLKLENNHLYFFYLSVTLILLLLLTTSCKSNQENYVIYDLLPEGTFTKGMEGPAVDSEGNLYAVNFGEQGTIGKVTPDGVANLFITLPEGSIGNGIRFDRAGSMYIADYTGHNILRIKKETSDVIEVYAHCSDMNQPNDLTVSPATQVIYASDPNWRDSTGNLWIIPAPDSVVLVEEGIGTTNGIEVSPDGKTLYVNESIQRKIWRYDIGADNMPVNKNEFYSFEDFGMDGMRCDNEGNLFVTRHGKGSVVKLSPKGELLHEYQLKGKLPTNLTFSNDFKKIFVTLADRGCFEVIDFTPLDYKQLVKQNEVKIIDIEAAVGTGRVMELSEIAGKVQYVPLETTKESLVNGGIITLSYVNGLIYVMEMSQVKIFDSGGKYLSTVNRQGRGPEEYTDIINAGVFPENGNIVVMTSAGTLNEYDIEGNFISRVRLPELKDHFLVNCFKQDRNTYVASAHQLDHNQPGCSVVVFDSLSSIKLKIPAVNESPDPRVMRVPFLYRFRDKLRFIHIDSKVDTIYSIATDLSVESPFVFNFGKYKLPFDQQNFVDMLASKTSNYITLTSVVESDKYIFLRFDFRGIKTESYERSRNIVCALFNKESAELTLLKEPENGKPGLRNDLENGPVFWPYADIHDNYMVSMYTADKFIQFADSTTASGKLKETAARVKEDDNPVVAIVKLK